MTTIRHINPLNDKKAFSELFDDKFQQLTFELLWDQVESLKQAHLNSAQPGKNYIDAYKDAAESVMTLAPKLNAVELLLCPGRNDKKIEEEKKRILDKPPQEIHHFLLELSKQCKEDDIKKQVVCYFQQYVIPNALNNNNDKKSVPDLAKLKTEFEQKLISAFETKCVTNAILDRNNTYPSYRKNFLLKFANAYSTQTTLEQFHQYFDQEVNTFQKNIDALKTEIDGTNTYNPIKDLQVICATFYESMDLFVKEYEKEQLPTAIVKKTQSIKASSQQIVDEYKQTLIKLIKSIEVYPENDIPIIENLLKKAPDAKREEIFDHHVLSIKNRFLEASTKLNDDLRDELAFDTKNPSSSKMKKIAGERGFLDTSIDATQLHCSRDAIHEIKCLKINNNSAQKIFDSTYKKQLNFDKNIHALKNATTEFLNKQKIVNLMLLQSLLQQRSKAIKELVGLIRPSNNTDFFAKIKVESHFDPEDKKCLELFKKPYEDQLEKIEHTFNYECIHLEAAYREKFAPMQHLLEDALKTRSTDFIKANQLIISPVFSALPKKEQIHLQKAFNILSNTITTKADICIKQIQEKTATEVDALIVKGSAEIRLRWMTTLSPEFKQKIHELKKQVMESKLQSLIEQADKKNIELKMRLLKKVREDEVLERKNAADEAAANAEKRLFKVDDAIRQAPNGNSGRTFAAAQIALMNAEIDCHRKEEQQNQIRQLKVDSRGIQSKVKKPKHNFFRALLAFVVFPIGWAIGGYDVYKQVSARTGSRFLGFIAGVLGSIYSWLRGVYVSYSGKFFHKKHKVSQGALEIFARTPNNDNSFGCNPLNYIYALGPQEPKLNNDVDLSVKPEEIKTCFKKNMQEDKIIFDTKPNTLYYSRMDKELYLQRDHDIKNDICLSKPAKQCMLRILTLIEKPVDLHIESTEDKPARISIKVKNEKYIMNPYAKDDSQLLMGYSEYGSKTLIGIRILQFATDSSLRYLLYPNKYVESVTNTAAPPASGPIFSR